MDIFIQTARYIKDHYPDTPATFYIFGDGPLEHELKLLSNKLGIDKNVRFRGHVRNMQMELARLDLLLLTSAHEGLPMVLLEAMTAGVPIIAHAVGGIPELLEYGDCGILIKSQDPAAYAEAIQALALSPEIRTTISTKALEQVRQNYSAMNNTKAYLDHYHAVR
jgi:glycosyltransferase involved in cell wall biosynthesis